MLHDTLEQKDGTREAHASHTRARTCAEKPNKSGRPLGAITSARRFLCSTCYATMAVDAMGEKAA